MTHVPGVCKMYSSSTQFTRNLYQDPLLGTFVFKGVIRQHQFYFGHPMKKVFAGE